MMGRNYERSASGLIVPRSNGFANRIIVDQMGAGSLTLPSWAKNAKMALMGSAGSGAAGAYFNSTYPMATAGGGGPLAIAYLNLDEVGRSLNYVLGAGGAPAAPSTAQGSFADAAKVGNPGALSSVVWGSRTITANPGQGGKIAATNTALTGGPGGTATGGDLNFAGGDGGGAPNRMNNSTAIAPGGGSSGRAWGRGLRGGSSDPATTTSATTFACPGASWGFTPDFDSGGGNVYGPGVIGLGTSNKLGRGKYGVVIPTSTDAAWIQEDPFWDLDDICGHGSGYLSALFIAAGAGGGGGAQTDTNASNAAPDRPLLDGGFGGGGGAYFYTASNSVANMRGGNGGRGGGGGAIIVRGENTNRVIYSGKGGDSYLSIWFN